MDKLIHWNELPVGNLGVVRKRVDADTHEEKLDYDHLVMRIKFNNESEYRLLNIKSGVLWDTEGFDEILVEDLGENLPKGFVKGTYRFYEGDE